MAITAVGEIQHFAYTGTVQKFVVPISGIYRLTVVGGDQNGNRGGKGGTSVGYILLKKGTIVYVCVGGNGNTRYNGGGSGYAGAGGATHMALMTGTLAAIGARNLDKILIVAGGGGGRYYDSNCNTGGGGGGGITGGTGETDYGYGDFYGGSGGSQTYGYAFGQGQSCGTDAGAGGGGLYGGYAGQTGCGGGGGSGYIGGVPEFTYKGTTYSPVTISGSGNSGAANGEAAITLIAEVTSIAAYLGNKAVEAMLLGDLGVESIL